jgi:hypothetical protein
MRAFLAACLALILIAVGGVVALGSVQKPAGIAYVGTGARVDPSWSWRTQSTASHKAGEAATAPCNGTWAMIRADFRGSPTADPVCGK